MKIIERARVYATAAHAAVGQTRKYTGEDYIVHPARVAATVASLPDSTDEMIAAAWLHDTVEDTAVTSQQLHQEFGKEVGDLVDWLTNVSNATDGNRATRKRLDRQHSSLSPPKAQTIKLADVVDNTRDIAEYDIKFAEQYINEKAELVEELKAGNQQLWNQAEEQIISFRSAIGNHPQTTRN